MKKKLLLVILLAVFLTGCNVAQLALQEGNVILSPEATILELTLSNSRTKATLFPLETIMRDENNNGYVAVDFSGDLTDVFGEGYNESVTGTITFEPIDPTISKIRFDFAFQLADDTETKYIATVGADVVNGEVRELIFGGR